MPLPWGLAEDRARIPDVVHRAITIKQLRELKTFVQRLTKTELLRNTTDFSKGDGTHGKVISWHTINLYQLTDEVLKKVIPFVDPEGERDPRDPKRRWYSWVEFVSKRQQPANIMFSHWWGGRFKDFMAVVDKLAIDRSLSINTAIWVCTFANCQFGEDFGAMLKDCPFIRTLQSVELTVLLVDYQGGSLARTWCGLEVHYSTQNELELALYTSAGRVGSKYVSGGPLVEAIKGWDIRRSEASDPPYRRQILNFVAGVEECRGLKASGRGQLQVDSIGRPQFEHGEKETLDPQAAHRIGGQQEYAHEAALFRDHGKKFEDLNMMVRLCVMSNIGMRQKPRGCIGSVPHPSSRGLTLNQLRVISAKLEATCPWSADKCPWWDPSWQHRAAIDFTYDRLTCYDIVKWVKHMTLSSSQTGCSFMELVAEGPQVPRYFMEHAWLQPWKDKMSALEVFVEAQQLPDSTVFFMDLLSFDQNNTSGICMEQCMAECEGVVLCASDVRLMRTRLWIWHVVNLALQAGKSFYIAFEDCALACSHPFASGAWICGDLDSGLASAFAELDFRHLQCSSPADQKDIMRQYNGAIIHRFNARAFRWFAGPILRGAARCDDAASIKAVCSCPGLRLNSDTLKANCGETPLHIAAARGSPNALSALLGAGADPNLEDDMKERPLHCAALAGHAAAARLLLAARADPWAENSFTETPLEVARQSPAAFLKVDTGEVVALLSKFAFPEAWRPGPGAVASETNLHNVMSL